MENCALVTGASSGIGVEIAHRLATRGYNILLVARRESLLQQVAQSIEQKHGVEVEYLVSDLTNVNERAHLCKHVMDNHQLVCLVNNAGFGRHGYFDELDRVGQEEMMELNMLALVDITYRLLPCMYLAVSLDRRKKKYILNVGSVAGFQPGPFMAIYYATKSFVLMFSEALAQEMHYKKTRVIVSVLCPGPTESEFSDRAGFSHGSSKSNTSLLSKMFKAHSRMLAPTWKVAEYGVNKMITRYKCVIIYGKVFKILYQVQKLLPRVLVAWLTGKIQDGRRRTKGV